MTDLEQFKALMIKSNADIAVLVRFNHDVEMCDSVMSGDWRIYSDYGGSAEAVHLEWRPADSVATIVRVKQGSLHHFHTFAADGSIIEAGQFEDM